MTVPCPVPEPQDKLKRALPWQYWSQAETEWGTGARCSKSPGCSVPQHQLCHMLLGVPWCIAYAQIRRLGLCMVAYGLVLLSAGMLP